MSLPKNIVLGIGALLLQSGAYALTLREAVYHTLETNPEILAAAAEVRSRDAEIRGAKAGYLPTFDVAAGIGRETVKAPLTSDSSVTLTRRESSVSIRQLVFDGFATREEVNRQTARRDSSAYFLQSTAENTLLRTSEVYLNLLRQQELLDLARETLYEHQNIHDQMVLRNKSGVGSKADLDQITARLALAQSNLITAQNNLLDAQANFYRVVALLPDHKDLAVPQLYQPLPKNLTAAEVLALEEHPTLLSARADELAAQAQHKAAASLFWPRLQIEANKSWDENIGGIEGENEDAIVALRLNYNLYNGGADKARRRQTANQRERAKEIRRNTHRQVIESLQLSWRAYAAIDEQIKYLNINVRAAVDTKAAYQKQFNIGRRTLLDLLNTENESVDARRTLIDATYDRLFAHYRIFNSMGRLLSEFKGS